MSDHDISAKTSGYGMGEAGNTRASDPAGKRIRLEQEQAKRERQLYCHYCGLPATGFGFFGEPVCEECGG